MLPKRLINGETFTLTLVSWPRLEKKINYFSSIIRHKRTFYILISLGLAVIKLSLATDRKYLASHQQYIRIIWCYIRYQELTYFNSSKFVIFSKVFSVSILKKDIFLLLWLILNSCGATVSLVEYPMPSTLDNFRQDSSFMRPIYCLLVHKLRMET